MMARVSDNVLPDYAQLGTTLDRYQELMGLSVCAFNGVNKPTDNRDSFCNEIVTQTQRDDLAKFLLQAEEMREEELGYFLAPKWHIEEQNMACNNPFLLDKKYLIEVGWPTWALIEEDYALDYGTPPFDTDNPPTDPVEILLTTSVSTSDIVVTYPDEKVVIKPSSISAVGTAVTIKIPRCRLVKKEYCVDRDTAIPYFEDEYFLETVDVWCHYADPQYGAEYKWVQTPCDTDCVPNCQPACTVISGAMAYEISQVYIYPATYVDGVFTRTNCWTYSTTPTSVRVTYKSGRRPSITNELLTIRLAHTLMPWAPCECDVVRERWDGDRTPDKNGQYSPYGNSVGAIMAWMADSRAKVGQGGMFPGIR
jgi:hypothetical protein